uniref:Uncharacterized protein n=1 Tax=Arundo donax TaxID=35708 RepID=A0A0A9A6X2_ARUDO
MKHRYTHARVLISCPQVPKMIVACFKMYAEGTIVYSIVSLM